MQVLLVGGAGYIGSHIVDLFLKNNIEIIVLDNLINSDLNQIKNFNIKTYIGDYGNNKILKQIFKENNIEAVIHLGGLISVSESVKHPINYYFNNLYKSHILINQCKKANIKYFLFASSASVYGKYNKIEPLTEDSIKKPNSPYGQTKLFTEKLLEKSGLCYGILRYFNVAGASNNIKECHKNEFHVIPKILESIKNNTTFKIFGNNYSTHDGTCIRDYIHVKDVAFANLLCLQYLINTNKSIILNIGSGKGTSILDLINEFQQKEYKINYNYVESKNVDSPVLIADINKAIKKLNWTPINSNISTIVQDYLNYQLNIS